MIHLELIYKQHLNRCFLILPILYNFIRYGDNNLAKDLKDRKSVMEYYFFLNKAIISFLSKKQKIVSTSITEAKYIAISYNDIIF